MAADRDQNSLPPECRAVWPRLGPDLDNPTPEIAAHLAGCAACRAEARRLGAAWTLLEVVDSIDPPPQFARRVWARIAAEESSTPGRGWGGLPVWSMRWAVSGMAVVLAAVVLVVVWQQDRAERSELVAQLDVVESREFLANFDVVENLDVLLLVDDP